MGKPAKTKRDFGCEFCWPASADEAWEAIFALRPKARLVDQSHFMVSILRCQKCKQSFVSIFTETIDWDDSEDPQYRTVMPVTKAEVSQLSKLSVATTIDDALDALAPERPSLRRDFPKGKEIRNYWSRGIIVGFYD